MRQACLTLRKEKSTRGKGGWALFIPLGGTRARPILEADSLEKLSIFQCLINSFMLIMKQRYCNGNKR